MNADGQKPERPICIACGHHIRGISASRIILWLAAITVVSFVIGFGILALSGGFSPAADQSLSPFHKTAFLTPDTTTVPLDGATSGIVKITLGAGDLNVHGGAPDSALMEGTVFTHAPEWQPDLVQAVNNTKKTVTITEKGHKGKEWFAIDSPNSWDISLNEVVPVRLDVNVGGGDCQLNLGSLNLEHLTVHNGAGDTTIDLGTYHGGRFDAVVRNGVGDITVKVPPESNTRIRADTGIGEITHYGFVQDGDTFVTAGFNPSLAVNEITLNQGVGSITLETV
jgi:hypothetical protein